MSQTPGSYQPYTPGRPGPEQPWRPSDAVGQRGEQEVRSAGACRPSYAGPPHCLVVGSVVCVVIWAASGGGYFWPIWVLLPTLLPVLLQAMRRPKK